MITEVETIKRRTGQRMAIWQKAKVRERGLGLGTRLYARSLLRTDKCSDFAFLPL